MAKVQLAAAFALAVLGQMPSALCSEDTVLAAGAWTAATDGDAFEVYADASGGRLAFVLPSGSHHFMVRVTKPSWHLAQGTKVPLSVSFATGSSFILSGVGSGGEIDAPVPDPDVAAWTHNFTALSEMTVGFPAAVDAPWAISLTGTTPTIEAMAHAIEVAGLTDIPEPFNPATGPQVTGPRLHQVALDHLSAALTDILQIQQKQQLLINYGRQAYSALYPLRMMAHNQLGCTSEADQTDASCLQETAAALSSMDDRQANGYWKVLFLAELIRAFASGDDYVNRDDRLAKAETDIEEFSAVLYKSLTGNGFARKHARCANP